MGGFMVQVADWDKTSREHILGNGQKIETEMAKDVGIKVFRFHEPFRFSKPLELSSSHVDKLVQQIKKWHKEGQTNMSEVNVWGSHFR